MYSNIFQWCMYICINNYNTILIFPHFFFRVAYPVGVTSTEPINLLTPPKAKGSQCEEIVPSDKTSGHQWLASINPDEAGACEPTKTCLILCYKYIYIYIFTWPGLYSWGALYIVHDLVPQTRVFRPGGHPAIADLRRPWREGRSFHPW